MSVQHARFNKFSLVLALTASAAPASGAFAAATGSTFNYFEGRDIDYWNTGKKARASVPMRKPNVESASAEAFDWSRYDDPRHVEFWEDAGNYLPPRPFREAAANPTPENIARYVEWQARKIDLVTKFHAALARAPPAPETKSGTGGAKRTIRARDSPTSVSIEPDWRQLELIYFYQTSCPHCLASKGTVEELKRRGVRVSFVQLDSNRNPPLHSPSTPYTQTLDDQFNVQVTPTWAFRRRTKTETLTGSMTIAEIKAELTPLFSQD